MAQLFLGIFLIALAAVMAWYGQQIARDGWAKVYSPSSVAVDSNAKDSIKTDGGSASSVNQSGGVAAAIINGNVTINSSSSSHPHKEAQDDNRDPDTIYQLGKAVGIVKLPNVSLSESVIRFGAIDNAQNLNRSEEFEYREYVLSWVSSGAGIYQGSAFGTTNALIPRVICKIVRPR